MRDDLDNDGDVIMSFTGENHIHSRNGEEFSRCPDCGVEVPTPNMELHKLRACRGRNRASAAASSSAAATSSASAPTEADNDASPASWGEGWGSGLSGLWRSRKSDEGDDRKVSAATDTAASTSSRRPINRRQRNGEDGDVLEVGDVINLADSDDEVEAVLVPSPARMPSAPPRERDVSTNSSATNESAESSDEWACQICTLLNPVSSNVCAACHHTRPGFNNNNSSNANDVRSPDQVRRERLIDTAASPLSPGLLAALGSEDNASPAQPNSPFASMGSGALLGSVLGAAGAYAQGGRVRDGALQGAFSGAVGAALLNEFMGGPMNPSPSQATPVRNSGATTTRDAPRNTVRTNTPTGGMRVVRYVRRPDGRGGFVTTMYDSSGGGSNQQNAAGDEATMALFRTILRSPNGPALFGGGLNGGNVDGMSYERLLEIFGDGSENRGAEEGDIQALPTATVGDLPSDLSDEARKCSICLEEFQKGDTRRMLPCLHGFHDQCVDQWLRTNASCPICKHSISN